MEFKNLVRLFQITNLKKLIKVQGGNDSDEAMATDSGREITAYNMESRKKSSKSKSQKVSGKSWFKNFWWE